MGDEYQGTRTLGEDFIDLIRGLLGRPVVYRWYETLPSH